ncbi:MAG: hypothetical protein ACYCZJ_13405 [Sulfuriferula sp.]
MTTKPTGASPVERPGRPRGLDTVMLTDSPRVRDGLSDMLTAAIGEHGYNLGHVGVQLALLVIEAAKRAEDREDWFPRGKWATVQAMQERAERELRWLFRGA